MSKVVKGVVTWIADEKKFDNYGFKIKGEDKFFNSPSRMKGVLEKGYEVKVVVEENERGNYDVKKKPVLIKKGTLPQGGGRGRGGFGKNPETEKRITAQHSQDVGVATVALLIANGGLKVPKGKPTAIQAAIEGFIDAQTVRAFKQAYNIDALLKGDKEIDEDLGEEEETEESSEDTESEDTEESEGEEKDDEFGDDVPWDED